MSNLFSNKNKFTNYYKSYNAYDYEDSCNVLDDPHKVIKAPLNYERRQIIFIINIKSCINNKIQNKENIDFDLIIYIPNCFFKALSQFFISYVFQAKNIFINKFKKK